MRATPMLQWRRQSRSSYSLSSCRSICGGRDVDLCYVRDNLNLRHFAHAEIRENLNRSLGIHLALRAFSPEAAPAACGRTHPRQALRKP